MPHYSVEMTFDPAAEASVRATWEALAHAGLSRFMLAGNSRPHVSLGVCEDVDVGRVTPALAAFAETVAPFPIALAHVGVFPGPAGVIFFGVRPSKVLLAVHAAFDSLWSRHAVEPWDYYREDRWVPHCTLAMHIAPGAMGAALSVCLGTKLPIDAQAQRIVLVKVSGAGCDPVAEFALRGGGSSVAEPADGS